MGLPQIDTESDSLLPAISRAGYVCFTVPGTVYKVASRRRPPDSPRAGPVELELAIA